jgi:hypothetical protein
VVTSEEFMEKVAIVNCHNTKSDGETFICIVHYYLVKAWSGEPQETKEMLTPTWFSIDNLPYDQMMLADKIWLPQALSGKKIRAEAYYGPFQKTLLRQVVVWQVDGFPDD